MIISPLRRAAAFAAFSSILAATTLHADVKLPAIFGDHMVLQEDRDLPVWGTAAPGEEVTVTAGSSTAKTTADAGGKWKVSLAPLLKGAPATTLTVTGKNAITFTDVLVGDVWICSGQSNMEYNIANGIGRGGLPDAAQVTQAANDPQLRLFIVKRKTSMEPETDVTGSWFVCTPDTVGAFSAVAYFFGQDLRTLLKKPIGLIATYWGGTPAGSWTSIEGLKADPALKDYVDVYNDIRAHFDERKAGYPAAAADYKVKRDAWDKDILPAYKVTLKSWQEAVQKAQAAGQPAPAMPPPPKPMPPKPVPADGGSDGPANLYNGMIAPLVPFAFKGVIWYQGESNSSKAMEYRKLFPDMITDWRKHWGQGDFPFLFVQLANFNGPNDQTWPYLREAQLMTLSLPNTGMASAVDIGEAKDIHPRDKRDVGQRLAQAARSVAYGENVVPTGPIHDSMKIEGGSVRLTFKDIGGGLVIGAAPWSATGAPVVAKELLGFSIAGADGKWAPADAKIDGDTVVVSSAAVPSPAMVRYSWANWSNGNLYNKEGLPASPFRTDSLPYEKTTVIIPEKTAPGL